MSNRIISSYEKQLPSSNKLSFWAVFGRFASLIGILAAGYGFYIHPNSPAEFVYAIFICSILCFLIGYVVYSESKKLHRYSESILFIAQTSLLIKDYLDKHKSGDVIAEDLKQLEVRLSDTISKCFTLLKGKSCSVCIKTLTEDNKLITSSRDSTSELSRYGSSFNSVDHYLSENTDFYSLFDDNNHECGRYFMNNNLKDLWKEQRYKNSSFSIVGEPEVKTFFKIHTRVVNWRLDYNSALVCPIRHISTDKYPDEGYKYYWGFLCIDSKSRGIFNSTIDPELAYCFANQIYTLVDQINVINNLNNDIDELYDMIDISTKPKTHQ